MYELWNGTSYAPPVSPSAPQCLLPTCNLVCGEANTDIAANPTNTFDDVSFGLFGLHIPFDVTPDAELLEMLQEWYDNCNGLLVIEFMNGLIIKLFKSQITDFALLMIGLYISYDIGAPLVGNCQSAQQALLDDDIIPTLEGESGVGVLGIASLQCCVFDVEDNEMRVKLNSCNGQEQIYQILVTDTENMCSNYIINQLPNG